VAGNKIKLVKFQAAKVFVVNVNLSISVAQFRTEVTHVALLTLEHNLQVLTAFNLTTL
jgi:hypothetical protein